MVLGGNFLQHSGPSVYVCHSGVQSSALHGGVWEMDPVVHRVRKADQNLVAQLSRSIRRYCMLLQCLATLQYFNKVNSKRSHLSKFLVL